MKMNFKRQDESNFNFQRAELENENLLDKSAKPVFPAGKNSFI